MKKLLLFCMSLLMILSLSACRSKQVVETNTPDEVENNINNSNNMDSIQTSDPKTGDKIAVIETNMGVIKFKMFPDLIPETHKNFETLANDGKYDGVIFHRVIKDFMVQGGDFENGNGTGGHSYKGKGTTIAEEFDPKLRHLYGAVSMAKTMMPHTTGSQFFIVHAKNGTDWLDDQHSVLGQVYEGMDVVNKIANTPVDGRDLPKEEVIMEKVRVMDFEG